MCFIFDLNEIVRFARNFLYAMQAATDFDFVTYGPGIQLNESFALLLLRKRSGTHNKKQNKIGFRLSVLHFGARMVFRMRAKLPAD